MNDRLKRIQQFLSKENIDGVFISKKANITYLTGFDFLAEEEREAFLFITHNSQYVITSPLYKEDVQQYVPEFKILDFVSYGKPFWEFIDQVLQKESKEISQVLHQEHVYRLGFETTDITFSEYTKLQKLQATLVPVIIDSIREIKTSQEIEKIHEACKIGDSTFDEVLKYIKPGMTEKQVAYLLEDSIRKQLSQPAFTSIVAFGKGASVPHHTLTDTKLRKKDNILLDFGAVYKSYRSDMSRTFFLGTPTSQEANVYQIVHDSQEQAFSYITTHHTPLSGKELDLVARNYITRHDFPEYPHSLGHSVGVRIHDGFALSPNSNFLIEENMVFSVEPGIYLPGNFGVRIEDIVTIQDGEMNLLTHSPRELIVL